MTARFIREKNIIVLHVPKTSGSSMTHWLDNKKKTNSPNAGAVHESYDMYVKNNNITSNPDYVLCCRNPYSWVYSFFRHNKRVIADRIEGKSEGVDYSWMNTREKKYYLTQHYASFTIWLENLDSNNPLYSRVDGGILNGQASFLSHMKPPKFIIRFEHLQDDIKILADYLGKTEPYPWYNKSRLTKYKGLDFYKEVYESELMINKVKQYFHRDFEYFGYSKEL